MHTQFDLFLSSIGIKLVMALTGLFIITFLVVHLAGNLQLLKDDGGRSFNLYADFMGANPLIQTISKVNFLLVSLHVAWALALAAKNRAARGKAAYAVRSGITSSWPSRHMGMLGTILLVFLIIHLRHFWMVMHDGDIPKVIYDGKTVRDLHAVAIHWFSKAWYVGLYAFCMAALACHLWHGCYSAFQTLGLIHMKYKPMLGFLGKTFAIAVPSAFTLIPVMVYFQSNRPS